MLQSPVKTDKARGHVDHKSEMPDLNPNLLILQDVRVTVQGTVTVQECYWLRGDEEMQSKDLHPLREALDRLSGRRHFLEETRGVGVNMHEPPKVTRDSNMCFSYAVSFNLHSSPVRKRS